MLSPDERLRYRRHLQLADIGEAGQLRLRAARVLVVGAGGLGCPILQYLAAAGVGTLGIADADRVEISNLQRQILYGPADLGQLKAAAAAREVQRLNPLVHCEVHPVRVTPANVRALLAGYDVVIDGSDNFPTRYLLNDACVSLAKPLVSGAIHKFEGQVSVFNYRGGPTYRCLFPTPPGPDEAPNCAATGVLGVLPGLVGTVQATEALKVVLGLGEVLSGRLWLLDALTMQTRTLRFSRHPERSLLGLDAANPADYHDPGCAAPPAALSAAELRQRLQSATPPFLLDVREPNEFEAEHLPGAILLPLSQLAAGVAQVPRQQPVVVYCRSGARSARAIQQLQADFGFDNLQNLEGGILAWAESANDPARPGAGLASETSVTSA
ncbi:molybdopterin-synthase adenylyltransferase MoeB [Hymenobacter gummosus]|uniref:Molybdopterin-synthase adenylyltransferase n=1 Tax=Hymenobacter gummosus TaxID=1776032 RepID=A0A3S0IKN6_9BACT|nr:molybdopterin-synthase adenylyltransferase MoeB [Hymenobacter gummosus]RTQ46738.1 molybdopterin-synthase adenylyltransferase MoeB [Hymenobacter gummosus]